MPTPILEANLGIGPYRIEAPAIPGPAFPGGVKYRFQLYDPDEGVDILRYDNAHGAEAALGPHHRHHHEEGDMAIEYPGDVHDHFTAFLEEVEEDLP